MGNIIISVQVITKFDKDGNPSIHAARQAQLIPHRKGNVKYFSFAGIFDYCVQDWHANWFHAEKCANWDKVLDRIDKWYQSHRHLFEV